MKLLLVIPEFKPEEVVVAEEVIDGYLHDPKSGYYTLVAEINSQVAGYICFGTTPLTEGTWDIYWMATAPEKQGQGIGSLLLASAEKQIRREGGRMAIIETSSKPNYENTRRFHINQGYEIIGRIPDFYTPGDDKLIMQKLFNKGKVK
jgi:ribosomal protein S18 acetylase RimI-like enzyme